MCEFALCAGESGRTPVASSQWGPWRVPDADFCLPTGSAPDGTAAALFILMAHLPRLSLPDVFHVFSLEVPLGAVPSEGGHQPAPSMARAAGVVLLLPP